MHGNTRLYIPALSFAIFCASAPTHALAENPFELSISLWKDHHMVGEPLLVQLELKNISDHDVRLRFHNSRTFAYQRFQYTIAFKYASQPAVELRFHEGEGVGGRGRVLKPGEVARIERVILPMRITEYGTPNELLPAGRYILTAEAYHSEESQPVHFQLLPAESPTAVAAAELMTARDVVGFFHAGAYGNTKTPEAIHELLKVAPQSDHARLARARIFINYIRHYAAVTSEPASQAQAKKDLKEAQQWIEDSGKDHPLADNVLLAIGKLRLKLREWRQAKSVFQRLLDEYPQADIRQEAQEYLRRMIRYEEVQRLIEQRKKEERRQQNQ